MKISLASILLLALFGCGAYGPPLKLDPRGADAAIACAKDYGSCFALAVGNETPYRVRIYVNGSPFGQLSEYEERAVFVRESLLREGRCISVSLKFPDLGQQAGISVETERECIAVGGYFSLKIRTNATWLVPQLPGRPDLP